MGPQVKEAPWGWGRESEQVMSLSSKCGQAGGTEDRSVASQESVAGTEQDLEAS